MWGGERGRDRERERARAGEKTKERVGETKRERCHRKLVTRNKHVEFMKTQTLEKVSTLKRERKRERERET